MSKTLRGITIALDAAARDTKFDLVINLKIAKALGITVSPGLLASADEVIE